MICILLAALQLTAASPARPSDAGPEGPLVVKDASRSVHVALEATPDGPMLRADALRPVVPVTVSHLMGERWMIIVNGTAIEVQPGSRFARVGTDRYQLASAPVVRRGALYAAINAFIAALYCSMSLGSMP